MKNMRIKEIEATSIITRSKLPDSDFVVNPYLGCGFACLYCYASFIGRFVRSASGGPEPISEWGNYVYVKTNAVELAKKELGAWKQKRPQLLQRSVLMSSICDPYQAVEAHYRLTRGILEAFVEVQFPGVLGVLTKSPMITRDIDLLKRLPNADVGVTVTTADDKLSRFLEVRAPLASRRLETLRRLNDEGIPTYAFVGPLLPHFRYHPELLDELFARLVKVGVHQVYIEHMNLKTNNTRQRLVKVLSNEPAGALPSYTDANTAEHREALDVIVTDLLAKHALTIRLGEVLQHSTRANGRVGSGRKRR
jgi:DNA repair photolyase